MQQRQRCWLLPFLLMEVGASASREDGLGPTAVFQGAVARQVPVQQLASMLCRSWLDEELPAVRAAENLMKGLRLVGYGRAPSVAARLHGACTTLAAHPTC